MPLPTFSHFLPSYTHTDLSEHKAHALQNTTTYLVPPTTPTERYLSSVWEMRFPLVFFFASLQTNEMENEWKKIVLYFYNQLYTFLQRQKRKS